MIKELDGGAFGGGNNPVLNYNPFSPNNLLGGYFYEPLIVQNTYNCEYVPWLATDFAWADPQTLKFTIRDGVKWSDGQPFSVDDVVYTFNLLKQVPAFDQQGIWKSLDSVSAEGKVVTFKFKEPSVPVFTRMISVMMLPKHIWEAQSDPTTFTDEAAVGTGPFMPDTFNGQLLQIKRNPQYWGADEIKVETIQFHQSAGGGEVEVLKLAKGEYDFNAMFVPNVEQAFVSRDKEHNHYWFPQGGEIALGMNLTKAPFNDKEFRHALAYAIDRKEISQKAVFGYVDPASQTGLTVPGQKDWIPSDIPDMGVFPFDQAKALEILNAAGYKKEGGKILGKDGKPLEFTFLVQGGWNDWIQAAQIVQSNLSAMGFTVNVQTPAPEVVESRRAAADYDMVFAVHGGSCSMYDNYYYHLHSESPATSNYIHHKNPDVDKMINQLKNALTVEDQKKVVAQLAKYSYEEFPTVPLWYGPNWFEYTTRRAVGWPSAEDPYAKPGDMLLILRKLRPAPGYNGK